MDKMSEHHEYLNKKVIAYSSVNHTRCFNHILNLTSKALLEQFDVNKKNSSGEDGEDSGQALSPEEEEELQLAEGIGEEKLMMVPEIGIENDEDALSDKDAEELEEWLDEVSGEMSKEEQLVLAANIHPVSQVLVKVWKYYHELT